MLKLSERFYQRYYEDWSGFKWNDIISYTNAKSTLVINANKLEQTIKDDRRLNIKFSVPILDSDIYIENIVPLVMLNIFIKTNQNVTLVIEDFQFESKYKMSNKRDVVDSYLKKIIINISPYIDITKINIRYNSDWLRKVKPRQVFLLMQKLNLWNFMQGFEKFQNITNDNLTLNEISNPIFTVLDSIELKSDIEVGLLTQYDRLRISTRIMNNLYNMPNMIIISNVLNTLYQNNNINYKQFDNYLKITDNSEEKFGKIMSLPDELLLSYYNCLMYIKDSEFEEIKNFIKCYPMEAKKQLAAYLIGVEQKNILNGIDERKKFEKKFSSKIITKEDCRRVKLISGQTIYNILSMNNIVSSKSELRRLFTQNGIRVITPIEKVINMNDILEYECIIKIGKKFFINLIQ